MSNLLLTQTLNVRCTQITAEGEIPGYSGSIRVCNFCYNILLQNTDISETITEIIDHGYVLLIISTRLCGA